MRITIIPIFFCLLSLTQAFADNCSEALSLFQKSAFAITRKTQVTSKDMKDFDEAYEKLTLLLLGEPCEKKTLLATNSARTQLKEKRLLTLNALNPQNSCTDVINQNEAVNLDNARNQDGVGWCYAYAASDLLSYRLKKKISAVSLYNSGQSIEEDISNQGKGGDIGNSIVNYLQKKNGLCLEENLPSSDFQFCSYTNYQNFLTDLYQSTSEFSNSNNQCMAQNLRAAFPDLNNAVMSAYVNQFGKKNLAEYLMNLQCKKLSFIGYKINPVNQFTPRFEKDAILKNVDALLNKGDIVGLACQYNLMVESDKPSKVGGHASVIVGRRQNLDTGECEYLVRNSWGKDCSEIEGKGLSCHKNCDDDGCRYSGHLWVSQRRIKNSLLGISFLP